MQRCSRDNRKQILLACLPRCLPIRGFSPKRNSQFAPVSALLFFIRGVVAQFRLSFVTSVVLINRFWKWLLFMLLWLLLSPDCELVFARKKKRNNPEDGCCLGSLFVRQTTMTTWGLMMVRVSSCTTLNWWDDWVGGVSADDSCNLKKGKSEKKRQNIKITFWPLIVESIGWFGFMNSFKINK